MGPRAFWGLEEALDRLKFRLSSENRDALKQVPFTEKMLEDARRDHTLAVKVGLSPNDMYVRSGLEKHLDKTWAKHGALSRIRGNIGWSLVRTEVLPNSLDKNLNEQMELLTRSDRIPSVGTLINAIIAYRLLNGRGIFMETFARCIDSTEELYRFNHCYHVSRTRTGELYSHHFSAAGREPRLGLATRKKTIPELLSEGIPIS